MRHWISGVVLAGAVASGAVPAAADALYEVTVRTTDLLVRGTVELEERVTVGVKGDRLRREMTGTRGVLTRRGARYQKPGHGVTLDQLDRGLRYDINLDAGTYVEESFATLRQQHEAGIAAAEKALGMNPADAAPTLAVSVDRTGEHRQVQGRECDRVVLKTSKEVRLGATRGGPAAGTPARLAMTFDLCLASDTAVLREARAVEQRVDEATGVRGALLERELRIFDRRPDIYAVFELMLRVLEREQQALGGLAARWERTFVGPRRDEAQATLFRQVGELTRMEDGTLDATGFELPSGLTPDPRGAAR